VAVDASGNVYVADTQNHTIRKITPAGEVTTFAGTARISGSIDGLGSSARFNNPVGLTVDSSGNVYVADTYNHTIRKITPTGSVTTLAGSAGSYGSADGLGSDARFNNPRGVVADGTGNIYVGDTYNNTIRKIASDGRVTTFAGTAGTIGMTDGSSSAARFNYPTGLAIDGLGVIYVADCNNHAVRKITASGVVTTFAGTAQGALDGAGVAARFYNPTGVTVDGSGNVYVADSSNDTIRKITPTGVVTTVAGVAGYGGSSDGTGSVARFSNPTGVVADITGNVYVADFRNELIRKITNASTVTTLAGSIGGNGTNDGAGSAARFSQPFGVAVDGLGTVYVADAGNAMIRKITTAGVVTTLGFIGYPNFPTGVSVDGAGNIYTADQFSRTIFKISSTGVWSVFAGGFGGDFFAPTGVAVDAVGNVYVADRGNSTICKIGRSGMVTTLAGSVGSFGSADGPGNEARFSAPSGVAIDGSGNVYVADTGNNTIRMIAPTGEVTTIAGTVGSAGSIDGTRNVALFDQPTGVAADGLGNVFVADTGNHTIRKISDSGSVTTIAGSAGFIGSNDGVGSSVRFDGPSGVAVDSAGNLYVADTYSNTIRKGVPLVIVAPSNAIITITVE
jgi:sugar lactone lactonase YvrE